MVLCILWTNGQKYNFKNYTVVNGLGSSSINNIFQDSRGYIWFATQGGGASHFNGKEFKNFTKKDGLVDNDVTYITEDKSGNIWIATAHGASLFNGTSFKSFTKKDGLSDGVVYCIYIDKANKVWFATRGAGVKVFDGRKFFSLNTTNGLPVNDVYSIVQHKSGNYWFGMADGIAKFDGHKITANYNSPLVKGKTFFSALTDVLGNVWFGSTSGTVVKINSEETIVRFELPENLKHDFIGCITKDSGNNIWFATDHGALKYNGRSFTLYSEKEGLSANSVQAIATDYESNIWIGTLSGGVNLLNSEAFVHYAKSDGLASNNISCIYQDTTNKQYYIGTAGEGLYILDNRLTPEFKRVNQVPRLNISSISIDKQGMIWLAAQEGIYIVKRQANSFSVANSYQALAGEKITSPTYLFHDSKDNCWVSTYGSGLFELNDKGWHHFGIKKGLKTDNILTVFEDSKSNIWIGTQDAGLIRYDGDSFQAFSDNQNIPDKAVWSITQDRSGSIFWGTGESGLYCFDGLKCYHYTTADGLCSNYINSVQWDMSENRLWLGSERGINKLQFIDRFSIKTVQNYNELNGFNAFGVKQNAILTDNNNLVWFASVSGLWRYNNMAYHPKNTPPKIELTQIRMDYQTIDWRKYCDSVDTKTNLPAKLSLPYYNNHLTFCLQALTTDNVSYTYKLEGQDKEWSQLTKNNEIDYLNIEPGKQYTFRAKAINSNGIASNETIQFTFTITPPWWKTWWFISAIIISGFGLVTLFIQGREGVLIEQNRKLEKTIDERTKEIAHQKRIVEETLAQKISLLGEKEILLKEIHHRVKNNLQTISSLLYLQSAELKDEESKKAIIESQNRVRSIALVHQKLYQNDGLEKIEFKGFAEDLSKQIKSVYDGVENRISIGLEIPEVSLLIDTAIPLGLILNELFTNSFKYAFINSINGEIRIKFIVWDASFEKHGSNFKRVKLSYWDNGSGLSSSNELESAATLGMELIKLLSEQIGATLSYSNLSGSEFSFIFDIRIIA